MFALLLSVVPPLLSLVVFTLGHSFCTSLVTLVLKDHNVDPLLIGLAGGAFFGGYVLGAFQAGNIIRRVGHIRTYTALASVIAITSILHGMLFHPLFWIILRCIAGYCTAGIYVAIESWLLAKGSAKERSLLLTFYMVSLYFSQAFGQFFLKTLDLGVLTSTLMAFGVINILAALSILPISTTKTPSPKFEEHGVMSLKALYNTSPTGVMGCLISGMILGSIYMLLTMSMKDLNLPMKQISWAMFMVIFGGACLQYPLGRLSDLLNRRLLMMLLCLFGALVSIAFFFNLHAHPGTYYVFMFLLGGLSFALYPLCIVHTCDFTPEDNLISTVSGLLLAYSVGATIGPIAGSFFVRAFGPLGIFGFLMTSSFAFMGFILWRISKRKSIAIEDQQSFFQVLRTTPISYPLDPRVQGDESQSKH